MSRSRFFPKASIFGSLLVFVAGAAAQEFSLEELLPGLRERAVVLDIVARVVEKNQQEVWNSVNSKVTIPGRPVGLKLVGANIVIVVQFTPYLYKNGNNMLVAQGQIWVDVPNQGIQYQTTLQTIPLEFGEPIYFFPLGSVSSGDKAHIEIQIQLHPYSVPGTITNEGNQPADPDSSAPTEDGSVPPQSPGNSNSP
ncbi:MAG: hypothetical protein LBD29_05185 [Treponema sp.]|jgi:hypothetical protein|nr:hypothetical protein [Treponema sp.]